MLRILLDRFQNIIPTSIPPLDIFLMTFIKYKNLLKIIYAKSPLIFFGYALSEFIFVI